MSLLTCIVRIPRTPNHLNEQLLAAVTELDQRGFRVRDLETPANAIEATVELETDAPINDDEDAIQAIFQALTNLDTDDITLVHALSQIDQDEGDTLTCGINSEAATYAQPCF
jgi:hypothetical protein